MRLKDILTDETDCAHATRMSKEGVAAKREDDA